MTDDRDDLKIITTSDGSHSVLKSSLNETYHSSHGAITESQHVFINCGLKALGQQTGDDSIEILEVGLGTGLNAFLTLLEQPKLNRTIRYTALEPEPLSAEIHERINYPLQLGADPDLFGKIHNVPWAQWEAITPGFHLWKVRQTLQEYFPPPGTFDLIYFDAFAPSKQPAMWEPTIISKLAKALHDGGIFVTYAATGSLRRALKAAGLAVEKLPGAPGKREMTRAKKIKHE